MKVNNQKLKDISFSRRIFLSFLASDFLKLTASSNVTIESLCVDIIEPLAPNKKRTRWPMHVNLLKIHTPIPRDNFSKNESKSSKNSYYSLELSLFNRKTILLVLRISWSMSMCVCVCVFGVYVSCPFVCTLDGPG